MNLNLNGIFIILISNVIITCLALYTDNIGFNPYIIRYDKTNYDRNQLKERHSRVKRSLDKHIYFTFRSHDIDFKLKLAPAEKHSYHNQLVEINGENDQINVNNYLNFYEGVLLDEPNDSFVSGSIIDGIFYGTIKSPKHGKFFIESAKRYNHTLGAHSIIYHENDIDFNRTRHKIKRSVFDENKYHQHGHEHDDDMSCASSRKNVKDWMKKEQEALYQARLKTDGFDPFSYIDRERYNLDENYNFNKYSREANENNNNKDYSHHDHHHYKKRDTQTDSTATSDSSSNGEPKRLEFPNKRTICNLYLRVDPQLHTEIFNNEGNKDNDKTTTFLLFYLNKHVEALNTIYNSLQFFDTAKEKYYVGLQFMIYRTKIITEEQCKNKTILSNEELRLCEPYLDVSTFLNYVSMDNFTDYCLSYTFTARDFTDGTLGLAWVAKLAGSVGGVCERRQILNTVAKSLNSGIVTVVNYQARVPEAVSQITFAHEVGHNFGSEHDPDDSVCSPGSAKGGNYIMYRRATTGTDKNNRNFSQCSRDQMGPIVHALIENKNKFCFKQFSGSLCGNGIVEEGEECDCGYGTDCKETCCIDASQDTNKCKLKPGKQCSPSQGPCCDNSCSFASSKTVCMQSNECLNNVTCTGKNASCPRFDLKFFKPDKTECNSGTQVCKSGICSGSICEKYEMRQCFLEGDLKDKKQDKAVLCHLACIGEKTGDLCVDSFEIPEMVNPNTSKGLILKPGSPCTGTLGYCDIFSKCRSVDGEGPLSRLKNFFFNPENLSKVIIWIKKYWWATSLIVVGLIVFMVVFIKVCSVHTPSSNPRKPPALKITETLRRPIKKIPHPHINLHLNHNGKHQSSSANQSKSGSGHHSRNHHQEIVNEKHVKSSRSRHGANQHQVSSSEHNNHNKSHNHVSKSANSHNKSERSSKSRNHHSKSKSKSPSHSHDMNSNQQVSSNPNHTNKRTGLFTKNRHKSNEAFHYYNSNHPLHPNQHHYNHRSHSSQPSSSSNNNNNNNSSSNNKHVKSSSSSAEQSRSHQNGRSKSFDEQNVNNNHVKRSSNSNGVVSSKHHHNDKKKSKTKSASPSRHNNNHVQVVKKNKTDKIKKHSITESSSIES